MWFKKKKEQIKQKLGFNAAAFEIEPKEIKVSEPHTLAQYRLDNGAKDSGAEKGVRMYNAHKAKIQNQWINPLQSINSGYGNAQLSYYNYQAVNYYECYSLAQDPLFNKIFNLLSNTPFANGGEVVADLSEEDAKLLDNACNKYKVTETITKCVRSNYVCGGCLLYLDFGDEYDLEEPLDLKKVDMDDFKGFRHIDPINITAVDVNTIDPSKADYMSPKVWYVIGLGAVHASHFLKFEDNIPELMMKPMCLYFGMPLTLLIKQDVANSNLASQGLANLMNRFRYLYLQTSDDNFTSSNAVDFRNRLEVMSMIQDNFGIYPLKSTEQIQQFTTSLTGMDANAEFFYQVIASKTDITLSVLLGKGAQGLSGTLEGERKNWYDRVRSIQQQNKHNLLVMLGIAFGAEKDGKFVEFADYSFNPLEQSDEREKAENLKSYTEVAKSLIEVGVKTEDILTWLKSFKDFHLENVELDDEAEDLQGFDDEQGIGTSMPEKANNAMVDNGRWITIGHKDADEDGEERKGRHLYLEDGETPKEAIDDLKEKEDKKQDKPEKKKEQPKEEPKKEEDYSKLSKQDLEARLRDVSMKKVDIIGKSREQIRASDEYKKLNKEFLDAEDAYYKAPHEDFSKKDELWKKRDEAKAKLDKYVDEQTDLLFEKNKKELEAIAKEETALRNELARFYREEAKEREKQANAEKAKKIEGAKKHYEPETIAGVKRGEPMSREKADGGNVNPNFAEKDAYRNGYHTNCQSCVVAYEARLRGYDVEVLPNKRGSALQDLSHHTRETWIDLETGETAEPDVLSVSNAKKLYSELDSKVEADKRYVFRLNWKGENNGHIVSMGKDENGLYIYDPQNGRTYYKDDMMREYLEKTSLKGYERRRPWLMRIDDKAFNPKYYNAIMKKKA